MVEIDTNSRKAVLLQIHDDLLNFDFASFDPRTDKMILMEELKQINFKLGRLLKEYK